MNPPKQAPCLQTEHAAPAPTDALLLLQVLVFLADGGGLVLVAGGAAPACSGLMSIQRIMNPEQIQSLEVLFLAIMPVALL